MLSRVRIRPFHILHFVMDFLFPLLKNSKSGVDDRGHRLRSGSPVMNLPGAAPPVFEVPWLDVGHAPFVVLVDQALSNLSCSVRSEYSGSPLLRN